MANGYDDDPNTSTTATPVLKPTLRLPPSLATAHLHRREDPFATPDTEEQDAHAFEIEKGFYKIQKSAQELLKLAATYQTHRSTAATASSSTAAAAPRLSALPPEIDMLSMTQLSWGVLHAVNDINNHNQRLAARDQASWLGGAVDRGGATPASCVAKRRGHKRKMDDGCAQCGVGDSPRWRRGPAGRSTLCNVCGLLYAKRVQGVEEDLRGG